MLRKNRNRGYVQRSFPDMPLSFPVSSLGTLWVSGCSVSSRSILPIATQNFTKSIYTSLWLQLHKLFLSWHAKLRTCSTVSGHPKGPSLQLVQLIKNETNKRCLLLVLLICYPSILLMDIGWAATSSCWCPWPPVHFRFPTASGVNVQGPEGREQCGCTLRGLWSSWWLENIITDNPI